MQQTNKRLTHMIPIYIRANYLPKVRKFKVQVDLPGLHKVELMTVARFLRFARSNGPIKIGGVTLVFMVEGPGGEERTVATPQIVRNYLRKVADSYVEATYKNKQAKGCQSEQP